MAELSKSATLSFDIIVHTLSGRLGERGTATAIAVLHTHSANKTYGNFEFVDSRENWHYTTLLKDLLTVVPGKNVNALTMKDLPLPL